jgi:hypothetical protein
MLSLDGFDDADAFDVVGGREIKAETLRDELINRRKMVKLSPIHDETKRALPLVSKVGPSCNAKLLKGVNCADIAKEVDVYARFIFE